MPRVSPLVIRNASRISRHLAPLLQECRDLQSARNELRWMKETILERRQNISEQTSLQQGRQSRVWDSSQYAGALWHRMSEEDKSPWARLAEIAGEKHKIAYPGYRYRPARASCTCNRGTLTCY